MKFDPYSIEIDGDLSRADAVVLGTLCRGKSVVEYGVGASTIILSQCTTSLKCLDTDINWINKTSAKIEEENKPMFKLIDKNDISTIPLYECDILFIDGHSLQRMNFLKLYWLDYVKEMVILHDSRTTYVSNIIKNMMDWYVIDSHPWKTNPYLACLSKIEWNYLDSNMAVLHKRAYSLTYENWNIR